MTHSKIQYDFDHSLGKITQQVSRLLGQRLEEVFAQNGISISAEQWSIISMLSKREHPTQKEIGSYLLMDKVSVNRTLDRLEKAGWVERVVSEQDRRSKTLALTSDGRRLYNSLSQYAEQVLETALKELDDQDTRQLFGLLEKVYLNLT
ncbi:MAG: MarR family transcriptional regulator [Bacteroidetes bacterium]|nr:MAG: MarR family transcriptional regulator [Bacteroidota bacterium]